MPHHRRRQRAVGIEAARLAREGQAGQPQRLHRLHLFRRHLALDPREEALLSQLLRQLLEVDAQERDSLRAASTGSGSAGGCSR